MAKPSAQQKPAQAPESTGRDVAVVENMPAFLQEQAPGSQRGRENVKAEDLVVPRLELVQDLSPARKKSDPNYIPGAEEGMLYNNVTRELYGTSVVVVPVGFVKEWLLWKSRDEGGGFGGAYPSQHEAQEAKNEREDGENYEVVDTNQQFCILVREDGSLQEIVVSMAKSKAKVSRKWNSLIRIANGDSFSRAYRITAIADKNKNNQDFFNLSVAIAGFPTEAVYRKAEAMYKAITAGTVRADRSEEVGAGDDGGSY